ncbi:MAG TPA: hypothetical protein VN281_12085 [Verrucomicrobiae bacterium]|jgi:hypothetical protein|nr:hypothetical protein [Verrucomicrobiae bacterium]
MIRNLQEDAPQREANAVQCRCPAGAVSAPRLILKFLDVRRGKTVRLYQCKCGEYIWDD